MAFVKDILIEIQVADVWTAIYCGKDASVSFSVETLKICDTVNGKYNKILPTGISGTMSTSGLIRLDSDLGLPELFNYMTAFTELQVRYIMTDKNGVSKKFRAGAYITNLGASFTVFSIGEQSLELTLSGIIEME